MLDFHPVTLMMDEDGLYIRLKQANITFVKAKSFVANCRLMLTCYYSSCDIGAGHLCVSQLGLGLACQTVMSWSGLGRHFVALHGYGPCFEILGRSSPGVSAILGLSLNFWTPVDLLSIKTIICL